MSESTWARSEISDAVRFDLLDEALFHGLIGWPGHFAEAVASVPDRPWILVDEVQRTATLPLSC